MKSALRDQKIFRKFCSLDADREKIITQILEKESIPYKIIVIDKARHIFIFPEVFKRSGDLNILIAHYDRVDNTPGANDNSASVFYLLNHARKLKHIDHKSIIIFTDREEIGSEDSVTNQGSYALGKYFRSRNLNSLRFFVFDMCGIGTTLLLGTAGETLIKKHFGKKYHRSKLKSSIENVKEYAEDIMLSVNGGEFFYLTPLFSDDLGLILNEYPAILISLLPYREAVDYKNNTTELPKSWRCNHTEHDSVETLDPKSWDVLSPLLSRISNTEESIEIINSSRMTFKCYTQNIVSNQSEEHSVQSPEYYIIKPLFLTDKIKTNNIVRLQTFQLLSSGLKKEVVYYLDSIIPSISEDFTYNLYKYIKSLVELEFMNLPIIIKDILYKKSGGNSLEEISSFLYTNILRSLGYLQLIKSKAMKQKVKLCIEFNQINTSQYKLTIKLNKDNLGDISIIKEGNNIILQKGYFNPDLFLNLDPLNMLKGIRLTLIKWIKLNNNDSLIINLKESNWIGCYQLYRLISMELEGRKTVSGNLDLKYLWKRYYGK